MKTAGGDAFITYHILYNYFKISKIRQRFKNRPIVNKSITQVGDNILNGCKNFKRYLTNTVGGDRFKKSLTDGRTDRQTDRRTGDEHRVIGKALADIVSWA